MRTSVVPLRRKADGENENVGCSAAQEDGRGDSEYVGCSRCVESRTGRQNVNVGCSAA